ncbi:MAG: HNH endonuclease domain-containing protein [Bullifex sp.]|nr:HNH endonuclease domain-containing protein [Bullifex sp.]
MKLSPPQIRKISDVASFWRTVMEIQPVRDIYSGEVLSGDDISIDHFIPWSYTASDEFWNLDPTSKSINSSKGNSLPEGDTYFPALCSLEYGVYSLIHSKSQVRDCFEKAAGNHFSSLSLKAKLFGNRNLSRETFSRILSEEAAMPL